jgi:ribonuclease HII
MNSLCKGVDQTEIDRLVDLFEYERAAWSRGFSHVAGIDEAGRGPLMGPVVAACVVFSEETLIPGLDDSKKLSEKKREKLYSEIVEKCAAFGIGIVDEKTVDEINILNATKRAMAEAVDAMERDGGFKADYLLIDAVRLDACDVEQEPIIKGDQKSSSIAAASILAKVTRDRMMAPIHEEFPEYGFIKHKGYGTKAHVEAIRKYGPCPYHRMTFLKKILGA